VYVNVLLLRLLVHYIKKIPVFIALVHPQKVFFFLFACSSASRHFAEFHHKLHDVAARVVAAALK
jgi:hypothetical protein